MKICCQCKQDLPLSDLYAKGAGRIQAYCKKCLCQRQMARWIQRKKDAVLYLGGKCAHCGYCRNYAALEFHHRNPATKEFNWQKLRLRPWKSVLLELDKCQLLCRNCHMEEHNPQAMLIPS